MSSTFSPTAVLKSLFPFAPWDKPWSVGRRRQSVVPNTVTMVKLTSHVSNGNEQVVGIGDNWYFVTSNSHSEHSHSYHPCPSYEPNQTLPQGVWEAEPSPQPYPANYHQGEMPTNVSHYPMGHIGFNSKPQPQHVCVPPVEHEVLQVDKHSTQKAASVTTCPVSTKHKLTLQTIKYLHEQIPELEHSVSTLAVMRDELGFVMTLLDDKNGELKDKIKSEYHYLKFEQRAEKYIEIWLTDDKYQSSRTWQHFFFALRRAKQQALAGKLENI
ncbi:hypothetical protein D5018_09125 [Parashewanella curva]|uniref:Uncharacterized protein n=1 Tax=Parashewanella curva TaxID=2338552 RepID=A0A3L8PYN9_9GAMM|nr:hypothetical protein [Parashewanella curva]RLV59959.1 hypothetical protein D5018_09125 [Parashewanella curva]